MSHKKWVNSGLQVAHSLQWTDTWDVVSSSISLWVKLKGIQRMKIAGASVLWAQRFVKLTPFLLFFLLQQDFIHEEISLKSSSRIYFALILRRFLQSSNDLRLKLQITFVFWKYRHNQLDFKSFYMHAFLYKATLLKGLCSIQCFNVNSKLDYFASKFFYIFFCKMMKPFRFKLQFFFN